MKNEKIKVNFHICESCNYHCKHCFAKFDSKQMLKTEDWIRISDNVINSGLVYEINIAGGEPLLYPGLMDIVRHIKERGVDVSLITNGHYMTKDWIMKNAGFFKTVGISIDTLNPELQKKLGRCSLNGKYLTQQDVSERIKLLREVNPSLRIKINTVVSMLNHDDNLAETVRNWKIDRWKIMKMQLFENEKFSNRNIEINNMMYKKYITRALATFGISNRDNDAMIYNVDKREIVAENILKASYIMVDSNGCLVDDSQNTSYTMISDCLTESFVEGFRKLPLNQENYRKRYEMEMFSF